jgi:mannose-6-phosphate isomerase
VTGVVPLDGVLRRYEWGSTTAIPRLIGVPADGRPIAELWFGAHPEGPATVAGTGDGLDEVIGADPVGALGAAVAERFGGQLPYLLKVLAAEKALSIQVHPNRCQAQEGFAAEEAAGVPRSAPERNYCDPCHKPELLSALTRFEALCGFRPADRVAALLDAARAPALAGVRAALDGPDPVRAAFTEVLRRTDAEAATAQLVERLPALRSVDPGAARALELTAADRPGDPGVVLTILLNYVRLEPGEALFLPAGNVHAHLRGTGVEVMASSDNVLRCGLTGKHVDVDELLRVADFRARSDCRWPAAPLPEGVVYAPPVEEFVLLRLRPDGGELALGSGPAIVLCVEGRAAVDGIELAPGRAAFVGADVPNPALSGSGTVFVARTGQLGKT